MSEMEADTFLNVRSFGARGVAVSSRWEEVRHDRFEWMRYEVGARHEIFEPALGAALDSVGIQKAIDLAAGRGGGTVVVPPGRYLIGPLELRSHVRLHLEPGAILYGSPRLEDYAVSEGGSLPRYTLGNGFNRESEGLTRNYRRLISAHQAKNFGITGEGCICAQSPAFVIPWLNARSGNLQELHRPQDTILFFQCEDVFLRDFSLFDTPAWSMVMDTCRGIRISGITLRAFEIINSDGIDLVNSSDATISDCHIHCTDDAICLKNSVPGATMRNIVVTNCVLRTLCNGFKIGTDSLGNFENITVTNLTMNGDDGLFGDRGGINLNALDGGCVRNVNISNIVMRNMFCPFYLYATARTPQQRALGRVPRPGTMERISITNVWADATRYPCYAVGHPESRIRDLHVGNINLFKSRDFRDGPPLEPVPELPDEYPTPCTFGSRGRGDELPAKGLYLRNVEDAVIRDFRFRSAQPDGRDVLVAEKCTRIACDGDRGATEEWQALRPAPEDDFATVDG
jgi:hypothetical protein